MKNSMSNLSFDIKQEIRRLGGIVDENPHEKDFVRVWFDNNLMTISKNGVLWTLTYMGETALCPEDDLPLTVRFLLNFTVKYNVVAQ